MKIRARIMTFLLAMFVIAAAWMVISGKAWFVPTERKISSFIGLPDYPEKIKGVLAKDKLDNLLSRWNEIGKAEDYKIGGEYTIVPTTSGELIKVNLILVFDFEYSLAQGAYLNKVNSITGKIAIATATILNPHMITMSLIYMPGDAPGINISVLQMGSKQIEELKKIDLKDWSVEAFAAPGSICVPPGIPLVLPKSSTSQ